MEDQEAAFKLFPETNREELGSMIDFLQDLIDAIQNLYLNGYPPTLGCRSYGEHNRRISDVTSRVLTKMVRARHTGVHYHETQKV